MSFFALSLPHLGDDPVPGPDTRVFDSKESALKALKSLKSCRLKTFSTREEALQFASDPNDIQGPDKVEPSSENKVGEGCLFKGLTPQELKQLKQSISDENGETFDRLVSSNPRYLMTPCDTPSVLHSGTRSNALHVAAQIGSVKMTQKILKAIQDPDLMIRMYPGESGESRTKRQEYLFDLYLNTPKKGDFDTPLHQASKYGHLEVVKMLSSFSSCDTKRRNKEDKTPTEVACSRMGQPIDVDVKRRIEEVLSEHVYIPVYRIMDYSQPAQVGDPWSPCPGNNSQAVDFQPLQSEVENSPKGLSPFAGSPVLKSPLLVAKSGGRAASPRMYMPTGAGASGDHSFISPLAITALLGPISPIAAEKIQKEWKKATASSKMLRLADPNKGLEIQGRNLAKKYNTGILEYWDFLNSYVDFSTHDGLDLLEDHISNKQQEFEEEEAKKLLELELDLADLDINSQDISFSGQTEPRPIRSEVQLGKQLSQILISDDFKNGNLSDEKTKVTSSSSPLSDSFLWNRPRDTVGNESLDTTDMSNDSFRFENFNYMRSSASSDSSYHSAASSLNDSMATADEGTVVYLEGQQPSQTDCQVFRALEDVIIDPDKHPNLFFWTQRVRAFPEAERMKWRPMLKRPKNIEMPRKLVFD